MNAQLIEWLRTPSRSFGVSPMLSKAALAIETLERRVQRLEGYSANLEQRLAKAREALG